MKGSYTSVRRIKVSPFVYRYARNLWLILLIFAGFMFLPWQQTVKGDGEVIAYSPSERNYQVYSPIDGFVDRIHVVENRFVKEGEVILEIKPVDRKYIDRLKDIASQTRAQADFLQDSLNILTDKKSVTMDEMQAGLMVYDSKIRAIEDKIRELEVKKEAFLQNYEITKVNYERVKKLFEEGIESQRNFELEKNSLAKAKADLESVKIQIEVEKQNLTAVKQEKEKFLREYRNKILSLEKDIMETKAKLASYQKELRKVESEISEYSTAYIRAKEDGYVVRIYKNDINQLVKKGEPVIMFAPVIHRRTILVRLPEFDMPLVKEGLPARIWFYGWPTINIPGWPVVRYGTFEGVVERVDPVKHEDGVYYAFVVETEDEKWPPSDVLRPGSRATVWIRLSVVPIWYEIWRKLNGFPPNMVEPKAEKDAKN